MQCKAYPEVEMAFTEIFYLGALCACLVNFAVK